MVLDALNVGLLSMNRAPESVIEKAIMGFVAQYGLLGLMTALPTTPSFMDYEAVYLPKNRFIKEERLSTETYISFFFPFVKPDVVKNRTTSRWKVSDRQMIALAMTMQDQPMAVNMSFQHEYAERYDWLVLQFKDWAFCFCSAYFYYNDADVLDSATRELYKKGIAAFGGTAPMYHIELRDKPTIVWDFHSLLLTVQMGLSLMLTAEGQSIRMCKRCDKAFVASRPSTVFCSPRCKNQYNVYKSRAKGKEKV